MAKFHDWVETGAGGASGWALEAENHEVRAGWLRQWCLQHPLYAHLSKIRPMS